MKKTIPLIGLSSLLIGTSSLFAGAVAGELQKVDSGAIIQLDGSQSSPDFSDEIIAYTWEIKESKQKDKTLLKLKDANTAIATFIAPIVEEPTVLEVVLTTQERVCPQRYFRSKRPCEKIVSNTDSTFVTVLPTVTVVNPPVIIARPPSVASNNTEEQNTIAIHHNGKTYLPVTSPITGRVWLDRNLDANQSCESVTDTECFGGLYQWGRETDGHQLRTSLIGPTTFTFEEAGNLFRTRLRSGQFAHIEDWIVGPDNDGLIRQAHWSSTDGSSVCPVEYRVPEIEELTAETDMTFMNVPHSGFRQGNYSYQVMSREYAAFWSTKIHPEVDIPLSDGYSYPATNQVRLIRTVGLSIRCIRD
jgi:hypothetical protein